MGAYIVKCTGVDKNADGSIAAIHCTADLETGNGNPADGRKVKGTIHWVSAAHCVDAEVRLYDKLFTEANMNGIPEGSDYKDYLNPESVTVRTGCKLEEVIELGREISNVVVGEIISMEKHPDADKLKVCRVDVGKEVLQIVTAATNVKTGDKIPLALNGATLAGGTVIKNGKLRGVASNGMMCGGEELGICEDQYAGASVDGEAGIRTASP